MPELPEVEVCRRKLARWLTDDAIVDVAQADDSLLREGSWKSLRDHWVGTSGLPLHRHGKVLLWGEEWRLGIHLRMTGRFTRVADEASLPSATRAWMTLQSGRVIAFVDPRRLAQWWWGSGSDVESWSGVTRHGPDAWLRPLSGGELLLRFRNGRRAVKVALMDQAVLAGIGNIAASEICYRAGVDPRSSVASLERDQGDAIASAIGAFLEDSIQRDDGTEIRYINERGALNPFTVYQHAGEHCPRCKATIARIQQAGRSTFFCPGCQPEPAEATAECMSER